MPGQPSSAGVADLEFINQLRSDLRDWPIFYQERVVPDGAMLVYRMQNIPHYDGDAYGAQPSLFSITNAGALQTLVTSYDQLSGAGQVFVEADTGLMYWNVAPTNPGPLIVNHRKTNWTNKAMRFALYSGLRAIFPKVFQVRADVTFPLSTLQWEYPLPAIFSDPRVRVMNVEVQEIPSTMERYREIQSWKRVGLQTLHIPVSQSFTPGSTVRVTYRGPVASLSDLDAQSQELPILYAKWLLLSNREAPRARQDSITATQGVEGVNPPGASMNVGLQFKQAFNQLLDAMPMVEPFVPTLSTYAR